MRAVRRLEGWCAQSLGREGCMGTVMISMPRSSEPGPSRYRPPSSVGRRSPLPASSSCARLFVRQFHYSSPRPAKPTALEKGKGKAIDMSQFPPERIRNLSIIAHIDHGKSTLADRLLQMTGTLPSTSNPQFLDKLKVERERGITVKAQTVSIIHRHTDGQEYLINLIDTPGHVDFSYEVSRSLGACEGGLLLVDCSQGIQAQTLSVFHVATEANLTLLPVINKVDLPHAEPEATSLQIESSLGLEMDKHMWISAKSGLGVDEVLRRIVEDLPSPAVKNIEVGEEGKLKALVFDTHYDQYRGVVFLVRLMSGTVRKGDKLRFLQAGKKYEVLEIGIANPEEKPVDMLLPGQVGYMVCNMKNSEEALIGDTICHENKPVNPLPGFKPMKAMVYAGVFPTDSNDFLKLEEAIERLTLNDRSVTIARESSAALAQGFRLGFLGTLHMDVFRQRLEDEYHSNVIITAPTVPYRIIGTDGKETFVSSPTEFPDTDRRLGISRIEEPIVHATIIIPNDYIGEIMDLCARYRATQLEYKVLETTGRAVLRYAFPLAEIVTDFFSELKGVSSGFASFDYEEAGYAQSDMVKLSILLNGKPIDALAVICHRSAAQNLGKQWTKKLREVVPRQLFELSIQAAIGGKVVARESISAMRKDVTAGLYGGHYERKLKHLEKQKEGKKNLKRLAGNIEVPKSAFFQVLSMRTKSYSTSASRQGEVQEAPPRVLDTLGPILRGLDKVNMERPERTTANTNLAELYRLIDAPRTSQTSEQIAKVYSRLTEQHSRLTGKETERVLAALSSSDRFSPLRQDIKSARFETIFRDYQAILGSKAPPLNVLVPCFRQELAKAKPEDRVWIVRRLERRILKEQGQIEDWESAQGRSWLEAATEIMRCLANLGFNKRLKLWAKRMEVLERQGVTTMDHVVTARMIAAARRGHSVLPLSRTGTTPQPEVATTVIEGMIKRKRWTAIGQLYSELHPIADDTPRFPMSRRKAKRISFPPLQTSQAVYSKLIQALALSGHLKEALLVMQDLARSEWRSAHIVEYSAFFHGFARYGEVPNEGVPGRAFYFFPAENMGRAGKRAPLFSPDQVKDLVLGFWNADMSSHRPGILPPLQVWGSEASAGIYSPLVASDLEGDEALLVAGQHTLWTLPVLQHLFESFLALSPSPPSQPTGRRAPGPRTIYAILAAFARMTRGDFVAVREAWEGLHDKFKPGNLEGWEGYTFDTRLSRLWTPIMRASERSLGTQDRSFYPHINLKDQRRLQTHLVEPLSLDKRARVVRITGNALERRMKMIMRAQKIRAKLKAYELAGRSSWKTLKRARRTQRQGFKALKEAFIRASDRRVQAYWAKRLPMPEVIPKWRRAFSIPWEHRKKYWLKTRRQKFRKNKRASAKAAAAKSSTRRTWKHRMTPE